MLHWMHSTASQNLAIFSIFEAFLYVAAAAAAACVSRSFCAAWSWLSRLVQWPVQPSPQCYCEVGANVPTNSAPSQPMITAPSGAPFRGSTGQECKERGTAPQRWGHPILPESPSFTKTPAGRYSWHHAPCHREPPGQTPQPAQYSLIGRDSAAVVMFLILWRYVQLFQFSPFGHLAELNERTMGCFCAFNVDTVSKVPADKAA